MIYFTIVISLLHVLNAHNNVFTVTHSKNISIYPGDFYLLNITTNKEKSQMKSTQTVNIKKNQSDFDCYLQIYYNSAWEQTCYFMYNTSATFTKLASFSQQSQRNADTFNGYTLIVIDNTYFPVYGAYFNDPLYLEIEFESDIEPDLTFYNWTLRVFIVAVCLFLNFSIWGIVILYKYKKEKEKIDKQSVKSKQNYEKMK